MKALAASLLALTLALPSYAQAPPRYVGTWTFGATGDWAKVLSLKVRDEHNVGWGSAVATGYTPYLEIRKADGTSLFATVSGVWADSTEKDAYFAFGQASCLAPVSGSQDYAAYLVLKKPGASVYLSADDESSVFLIRAKRWP
jgi:hypothetical protein